MSVVFVSSRMDFTGRTVAFHTLGCKLNFSETSAIARQFLNRGFVKKDFAGPADVYVINTCSVTENADRECRSVVSSALARNPSAIVAVTGCYAQLKPDSVARIPGVDFVLGTREKFSLVDFVEYREEKGLAEIHHCDISGDIGFQSAYSLGDRTRSFLKVQDGCDYSCTFCTIPMARGKSRSDTADNVIENARRIAEAGVKEIVLTGVNLGDFGLSDSSSNNSKAKRPENFYQLIRRLDAEVPDIHRFRISSIEPNLLHDDIIQHVSRSRKFVPHFHIPLQSGSNTILKAMKRRYLRELYAEKVEKIKKVMPHCCIGVDVIVGFPGETEEHFNETVEFIRDLDISYLHVFTYSERTNTPAAEYPGVVPVNERKRRNKILRLLSARKLNLFYEQQANSIHNVLFESENRDGYVYGFTENYVRVKHKFTQELAGSIVPVLLENSDEDGALRCTLYSQTELV